jgi:Arc/MetJ-type ribon-helix-helix transcriptional regulator
MYTFVYRVNPKKLIKKYLKRKKYMEIKSKECNSVLVTVRIPVMLDTFLRTFEQTENKTRAEVVREALKLWVFMCGANLSKCIALEKLITIEYGKGKEEKLTLEKLKELLKI